MFSTVVRGLSMNFDDSRPIYLQIAEYFKQKIIRGEIKFDDKMPSVRETAKMLSVNPNTVQRAYALLEQEGVTRSERGKGFFIKLQETDADEIKIDMAVNTVDKSIRELKKMNVTKERAIKLIDERW